VKTRLPRSFYNTTTLVGALLALLFLLVILFLFALEVTAPSPHPYMGLVAFIILPLLVVLSLLVALVGILRTYRRLRASRGEFIPTFHLDLSSRTQRNAAILVAGGSGVFLLFASFTSYQAYEYTDSVEFCGRACHAVMKPEYTAYKASPHARVACVACHIGPGATWFVKSKLSGSYQVYSTIFHKYHRPIETPIANLRPARETCEQCHWPQHFYAAKQRSQSYFLSDENNTRSDITLLMKIGGGDPGHGAAAGIHYHMYLDATISYVAADKKRLVIPYVEVKYPDGTFRSYRSTENSIPEDRLRQAERHVVDCIECHNRPTHRFRHPAQTVNLAMSLLKIKPDLPGVKAAAVEALEKPYRTEAEGLRGIRQSLETAFRKNHPDIASRRAADIDAAVQEVQRIFRTNYFPEMRANWKEFPDHIGHLYSPGCFRCHDGKHVSPDGRVISKDCNQCHTILAQSDGKGGQAVSLKGLSFRHPGDVGDAWKDMNCSDCHAAQEH
jgi:nitrate/TMAO reductase-like tetraheme cytochrome c subunit